MGMDRAAAAARAVPGDDAGSDAGLTLAALIDVLDRADEVLVRTRPRPRRSAMHRSPAARSAAARSSAVRSAPAARRSGSTSRAVLGSSATDRPVPRVVPARSVPLRSVPPAPPARVPVVLAQPATQPSRPPVGVRLRAVLSAVVRRAALWGAGPGGAHLAWNAPPPPRVYRASGARPAAAARTVDPPVVLRELPSTPTTPPTTPPAARTAGPVAHPRPRAAVRNTPARPLRIPALSTVRRIPPLPPAPGGVPNRARSPGGVRGSPGSAPARGSPPWRWPDPGW